MGIGVQYEGKLGVFKKRVYNGSGGDIAAYMAVEYTDDDTTDAHVGVYVEPISADPGEKCCGITDANGINDGEWGTIQLPVPGTVLTATAGEALSDGDDLVAGTSGGDGDATGQLVKANTDDVPQFALLTDGSEVSAAGDEIKVTPILGTTVAS